MNRSTFFCSSAAATGALPASDTFSCSAGVSNRKSLTVDVGQNAQGCLAECRADGTKVPLSEIELDCQPKRHHGYALQFDLTGQRFGRFTAIRIAGGGAWLCVCDCGTSCLRNTTKLRKGIAVSCGCIKAEIKAERDRRFGWFSSEAVTTAEAVRSVLDYDPNTGVFTWGRPTARRCKPGDIATHKGRGGYMTVRLGGKSYQAHRVAWLYVHGVWPAQYLDHKNLVRSDNRIDNLREANDAQNRQNTRLPRNNTSGFKGVTKSKGRWVAQIDVNRKAIRIGSFGTPEEASAAYLEAKRRLHPFYIEGQGVSRG